MSIRGTYTPSAAQDRAVPRRVRRRNAFQSGGDVPGTVSTRAFETAEIPLRTPPPEVLALEDEARAAKAKAVNLSRLARGAWDAARACERQWLDAYREWAKR